MKNLIHIENRSGKVSLNETVSPASINRMIEEMQRLYGQKAVAENHIIGEITCSAEDVLESVNIEIHTPGGSVFDGYRMFHAISEMRGRGVHVTATVNTLAASMGSVIAMAADEVHIVTGGRIMIHEASQGVHGTAEDHARAAKNLDEMSNEIAVVYADKTGKPVKEMRALMKAETWMGAEEAVAMGFADKIIKPGSVDTGTKAETETMGLFTKNESATAVIALESENAELRTEFAALQSQAAESAERVVALREELATATAELVTTSEALKQTADELATAQEAVAGFDDKVEAAAMAKFASLGGDPIVATIEEEKPSELSRESFNALSPSARLAFVKNGGKLS
jgi:ATP-dependent protease ClpP protease subunit